MRDTVNNSTERDTMRTPTEIRAEIKKLTAWGNRQNAVQGGSYDHTDSSRMDELMAELDAAETAEWADPQIVAERRAKYNQDAQAGMTAADLAAKYGYSYRDRLVSAIANLGL
jgi:hypothetical protein